MQTTTTLYRQIISGRHYFEVAVGIGEAGRLADNDGNLILFGLWNGEQTRILIDQGGAEAGYRENVLLNVKIHRQIFSGDTPEIGRFVSSEIDVEMIEPDVTLPTMGQIIPYVRACDYNGNKSEWLQKGVFYIDTREITDDDVSNRVLKIHGYDAALMAEQDFDFAANELASSVIRRIANELQLEVDARTWSRLFDYRINIGTGYSMREVLGYIAAVCGCGNFIITDLGQLLLVPLNSIPEETNLLLDHAAFTLTFGAVSSTNPDEVRIKINA